MRTLVKLGILATAVTFLISTAVYAQDCGSGGLVLKVTPSTLNMGNEGKLNSAPVIKAHIKNGASQITDPNSLKIICINGVSVDIPAVPGMSSVTEDGQLDVTFYRGKLVEAVKSLGVSGDVSITVGSAGGGVSIPGSVSVPVGTDTPIYTGDLTGFTNLNLGTPSVGVTISITIVSGGTLAGGCQIGGYPYPSSDPLSLNLDTSECGGLDLTDATLSITVYGDASEITFTGITLTGPGGAGVSGTDTIRVDERKK